MQQGSSNGHPEDPSDWPLHPALDLEELRQTTPSRIAYHQRLIRRGGNLPLGKQIGLLLWMNDHELLSPWGGARRLVLLQRKASLEALLSAVAFREHLNRKTKQQCDFIHHAVVLNAPLYREVPPKRLVRRLGVGYRDKGSLPEPSNRARQDVEASCWFYLEDIGKELADGFPCEGEWVDLSSILTQTFPDP